MNRLTRFFPSIWVPFYFAGIITLIQHSHLLLSISCLAGAAILGYIVSDFRKYRIGNFLCLYEASIIESRKQRTKNSLNAFITMIAITVWFIGFRLFGVVPMLTYPMAIGVLIIGVLCGGFIISMLIPPIRKKFERYLETSL